MINMHVYLPEKYRSLFFMEFSFSQKFESLIVSFDGFSALAYSNHILWFWPLKGYNISILLCPQTFIWRIVSFAQHFLFSYNRNHGASPMCFGGLPPPVWSCLQVFNLGFPSGWGYVEEDLVIYKELFSWRIFRISKLFWKIILMFV